MLYLVCFDISDDKVRRDVGNELEHWGLRVQHSVFEVDIRTERQLNRVRDKLAAQLDSDDDLRFYALCAQCRKRSYDHHNQRIAYQARAVII